MSLKPTSRSRRQFLATAGAAGALPLLGRAAMGANSFPLLSGRTVTLIIGADLGGGYDIFGRAFARYLQEIVPGLSVAVQNVPKAGGKLAAKTVQEGPADGSVIAMMPAGLMSAQILQEEGVAYDATTWSWIGKLAAEARLYVAGPGADFATVEELRQRGSVATMSVRSNTSFAYYEALWVNAMLGIRVKPVPGYKSAEKEQAMVAGEVMLTTANYPDDLTTLRATGTRVVLRVNETEVPAPYDQAPTLRGLMGGSGPHPSILEFLEANYALGRWIVAPPATDPAVLAEWRSAFDAAVASSKFAADVKKLNIELAPMGGAELGQRMTSILSKQDALRAEMSAALECGKAMAEGNAACQHS